MNKLYLLSLASLTFGMFACLALAAPESETGLEGVITISPVRGGPEMAGVPNSRPFANIDFIVKKGDETVASFKTDEQGRFRLRLAPGHYIVSMKEGKRGIGRHGPFEVDVIAGQMKQVQWTCDSGMR